jgi:hypothetical protein
VTIAGKLQAYSHECTRSSSYGHGLGPESALDHNMVRMAFQVDIPDNQTEALLDRLCPTLGELEETMVTAHCLADPEFISFAHQDLGQLQNPVAVPCSPRELPGAALVACFLLAFLVWWPPVSGAIQCTVPKDPPPGPDIALLALENT